MKTGWRGPCPYKPTKPIRLNCPLRAADLPCESLYSRFGAIVCFHCMGDSLFSRFSFVSAPRFDAGESAIVGAEGLSPWRWHKGVFLVLVSKTKMHRLYRVRRYFLVHHIEHIGYPTFVAVVTLLWDNCHTVMGQPSRSYASAVTQCR